MSMSRLQVEHMRFTREISVSLVIRSPLMGLRQLGQMIRPAAVTVSISEFPAGCNEFTPSMLKNNIGSEAEKI